ILDNIDAIYGNHLWSLTELGKIETRVGSFMSGADSFNIKIKCAGGHGAYPHQTKDSIVIAAEFVSQLLAIFIRKINPNHTAVLTIVQFNAGTAFNIIADEAELIGTVRFFDLDIQEQIINEMQQIIDGMKKTHNIEIIFDYQKGHPPVVNH